jgi:hypothetical protein
VTKALLLGAGNAAQTPIPTGDKLSQQQLDDIAAAAFSYYAALGVSESALQVLRQTKIHIADLGGGYLAQSGVRDIWLDDDAAGAGWFVDATPWESSEHELKSAYGSAGQAKPGSLANSHIDVLTTVLHELSHILGLNHSDDPADLLFESLEAGTRKTLSSKELDDLFAQWI